MIRVRRLGSPLIRVHLLVRALIELFVRLSRPAHDETVGKIHRIITELRIAFFHPIQVFKNLLQAPGFRCTNQTELVSSDAVKPAVRLKASPGGLGKGTEISVSGSVPSPIIKGFQMIQIKVDENRRRFRKYATVKAFRFGIPVT